MSVRRVLLATLPLGVIVAALLAACESDSARHESRSSGAHPRATHSPSATPSPVPARDRSSPSPARSPAVKPVAVHAPAFPGLPPLELPLALVELPEHDLFLIAIQDGVIYAIPRDGPYDTPRVVHDQRDRTLRATPEEGLLSLVRDPDFARNGYLYAYYSHAPAQGERVSRLVRFGTTGEGVAFAIDGDSELIILEIQQPQWSHNGGGLAFGPDGMLYLGLGDGGGAGDPRGHGQNLQTLLGSILRIDVREASPDQPYIAPPDNPFPDVPRRHPEMWAYGLRNPWRMSFDRETGLLWVGDVGQASREEVNIIESGGNYGWNVMEGTLCFLEKNECDSVGLAPPVWEYGRSSGCSIIGGGVYRGAAIPALRGWYVFSDYCTGRVWAIHAATAAAGGSVEPVLLWDDGPGFVLSIAEDASGELYLLTAHKDSPEGVFRVSPPSP